MSFVFSFSFSLYSSYEYLVFNGCLPSSSARCLVIDDLRTFEWWWSAWIFAATFDDGIIVSTTRSDWLYLHRHSNRLRNDLSRREELRTQWSLSEEYSHFRTYGYQNLECRSLSSEIRFRLLQDRQSIATGPMDGCGIVTLRNLRGIVRCLVIWCVTLGNVLLWNSTLSGTNESWSDRNDPWSETTHLSCCLSKTYLCTDVFMLGRTERTATDIYGINGQITTTGR